MPNRIVCYSLPALFLIMGCLPMRAQLFDDLTKRDNVSNKTWFFGASVGGNFASYSINAAYDPADPYLFTGESYSSFGFQVDGVALRSFGALKAGPAVSFQRFSGSPSIEGRYADDPAYASFLNPSINALCISARGEVPFVSSVEGGIHVILEVGTVILSGEIPGSSVSPSLRGALGFGYDFRINDKSSFHLELLMGYYQFKNDFLERELSHIVFQSGIAAGLRF